MLWLTSNLRTVKMATACGKSAYVKVIMEPSKNKAGE